MTDNDFEVHPVATVRILKERIAELTNAIDLFLSGTQYPCACGVPICLVCHEHRRYRARLKEALKGKKSS